MARQAGEKIGFGSPTLLLLPGISFLAYQCMLVPLFAALADSKVKNASSAPPTWEYTGYGGVDETLTLLINFFLQSFDNGRFALMPEFIASVGPAAIVPIIEMRRSGYHTATVFASMLVLGFFYQNFGAGVILPLWWAPFLWLSGQRTAPLPPQYANATLAGYFLGFVAVSTAMIVYQTPGIIAFWQFFPGYILLAQIISLGAQLPLAIGSSGSSYDILQAIHTFNFGWSAVTHAYTLFRAFSSSAPLDSLKDSYLPNYSSASVGLVAASSQAFCKWDLVYITAATLFAGLWLLRGTNQRLLGLGWFVLGSVGFGAGAGLSSVWMLREKQLKEDQQAAGRLKQN
ncbi:hypothetical protein FRC08_011501 [Ceratobasidium sp. 394]|nr:hypothetical protein FRC08_011501 [Ceratobasidium sp. 394]KAG9092666.1 hypothetical protein FS749_015535 [Ceratobasidium sp. UAMH 11750]